MSLLFQVSPSLEWLQMANKYIEKLYTYKYDKWTKSVNISKREDTGFEKEFDFIGSCSHRSKSDP